MRNGALTACARNRRCIIKLLFNLLLPCRYLIARTPFESLAEARLTAGQNRYRNLFEGKLQLSDRSK